MSNRRSVQSTTTELYDAFCTFWYQKVSQGLELNYEDIEWGHMRGQEWRATVSMKGCANQAVRKLRREDPVKGSEKVLFETSGRSGTFDWIATQFDYLGEQKFVVKIISTIYLGHKKASCEFDLHDVITPADMITVNESNAVFLCDKIVVYEGICAWGRKHLSSAPLPKFDVLQWALTENLYSLDVVIENCSMANIAARSLSRYQSGNRVEDYSFTNGKTGSFSWISTKFYASKDNNNNSTICAEFQIEMNGSRNFKCKILFKDPITPQDEITGDGYNVLLISDKQKILDALYKFFNKHVVGGYPQRRYPKLERQELEWCRDNEGSVVASIENGPFANFAVQQLGRLTPSDYSIPFENQQSSNCGHQNTRDSFKVLTSLSSTTICYKVHFKVYIDGKPFSCAFNFKGSLKAEDDIKRTEKHVIYNPEKKTIYSAICNWISQEIMRVTFPKYEKLQWSIQGEENVDMTYIVRIQDRALGQALQIKYAKHPPHSRMLEFRIPEDKKVSISCIRKQIYKHPYNEILAILVFRMAINNREYDCQLEITTPTS